MAKGKTPKPGPKSGAKKSSPSMAPSRTAGMSGNAKSRGAKAAGASARIFPVDTRFQQLARRIGGVPRERAIKRAQLALEEIKPAYEEFLEREVTGLSDLVKNVEAGHDEPALSCSWRLRNAAVSSQPGSSWPVSTFFTRSDKPVTSRSRNSS